jgi:hypothetical protein
MKEDAKMRTALIGALTFFGILLLLGVAAQGSTAPSSSIVREELQKVRYGYASQVVLANSLFDDKASTNTKGATGSTHKSPGKAFLMSLILPGAGQYYYGSKVKAAFFLGIEAATIGLSMKYHSQGNDLTTAFQEYNAKYWKQDRYVDYLRQAYQDPNITSDAGLDSQEISHHLPPFGDGQYYEMTGKYDQFAWGWVDAQYHDSTLYQPGFTPQRITDPSKTPYSARRFEYERMRHDANSKFTKATTMLFGTLLNHVVSAFEAYISTRRHNQGPGKGSSSEFSSHIRVNAQLKSVYSRRDTPYLKVTYKF